MDGLGFTLVLPIKLISFVASIVTLPVAMYYMIRAWRGFAPRTWIERYIPFLLEGQYRPEYRAYVRRARFWLLAAFISMQILWHTGEYLDSIRGIG